jgi:hypothetical protein
MSIALLKQLFYALPNHIGVVCLDDAWRFVLVNRAAETALGIRESDVHGKSAGEISQRSPALKPLAQLLQSEPAKQVTYYQKTGWIIYRCTVFPLAGNGKEPSGTGILITPYTTEKRSSEPVTTVAAAAPTIGEYLLSVMDTITWKWWIHRLPPEHGSPLFHVPEEYVPEILDVLKEFVRQLILAMQSENPYLLWNWSDHAKQSFLTSGIPVSFLMYRMFALCDVLEEAIRDYLSLYGSFADKAVIEKQRAVILTVFHEAIRRLSPKKTG